MKQRNFHILVIDDDTRIRDLLTNFLVEHGYIVSSAKDAEEARRLLSVYSFDLLVMDVMMPGETGTELTSFLRKTHIDVPILMLTAMGEVEQRIAGLECGADDYLPKPFDPKELLLRIQKLLKRSQTKEHHTYSLNFGDASYEILTGALLRGKERIILTSNEEALLSIFVENLGQAVSREALAKACGGINIRSVDVQVTRLRQKLEDNPKEPLYLRTIRHAGYVLHAEIGN